MDLEALVDNFLLTIVPDENRPKLTACQEVSGGDPTCPTLMSPFATSG